MEAVYNQDAQLSYHALVGTDVSQLSWLPEAYFEANCFRMIRKIQFIMQSLFCMEGNFV